MQLFVDVHNTHAKAKLTNKTFARGAFKQERAYSGCKRSFSLAWRLDREMRRLLILHERGFSFLLPTLSSSMLFICFWIDLVRMLATTRNTSVVAGYMGV